MQVKPKIILQIDDIENFTKANEILYKEYIDPIRITMENSITILIRTGAIDIRNITVKTGYSAMKKLIGNAINNIAGTEDGDPIIQKNINSSFSKEKIIEIWEIMVEDVRIFKYTIS